MCFLEDLEACRMKCGNELLLQLSTWHLTAWLTLIGCEVKSSTECQDGKEEVQCLPWLPSDKAPRSPAMHAVAHLTTLGTLKPNLSMQVPPGAEAP